MKIYTETHHTIYIGDTDITAVVLENGLLSHILITSVLIDNAGKVFIDDMLYLKHVEENKKDLKKQLVQENLFEKGIVKAIKELMKKV